MDDDEKAELARQGMRAVDLAEPGALGAEIRQRVRGAAADAALGGLARLGRLRGTPRSPGRARAAEAVDLAPSFADFDRDDAASFEQRLHQAAAEKASRDETARETELAAMRRSFPEPARELALLVFNCVDLIEDLADDAEGQPPPAAEHERKERLLRRIAELVAPSAGAQLLAFVDHVIELSRRDRGA